MIIGIPKEIKNNENRVSLTPENVLILTEMGHKVLVQKNAGEGSGFTDNDYKKVGAEIVESIKRITDEAEMIIKVKEPLEIEYPLFHKGQIIFTFFHFASNPNLVKAMVKKKVIAIAYETVQNDDKTLPLLIPMSEVAGKLSAQIGASLLTNNYNGRGILIGGVTGTMPAKVLIIGAGTAGENAAKVAAGMGANVTLLDININRLKFLANILPKNVTLIKSNSSVIDSLCKDTDILIGAVLVAGEKAPKVVMEKNIMEMKKGSVVIDISIDQGGCIETSYPTTHVNPTFIKHGVIHYCVANIPAIVPRTSTIALSNATIPFVIDLANKGFEKAVKESLPLRRGLSIKEGEIVADAIKKLL